MGTFLLWVLAIIGALFLVFKFISSPPYQPVGITPPSKVEKPLTLNMAVKAYVRLYVEEYGEHRFNTIQTFAFAQQEINSYLLALKNARKYPDISHLIWLYDNNRYFMEEMNDTNCLAVFLQLANLARQYNYSDQRILEMLIKVIDIYKNIERNDSDNIVHKFYERVYHIYRES